MSGVGERTGTSGKGPCPGTNPLSGKGDGDLQHCLGVASPLETLQNPNKQAEDPKQVSSVRGIKSTRGRGAQTVKGAEAQGFLH